MSFWPTYARHGHCHNLALMFQYSEYCIIVLLKLPSIIKSRAIYESQNKSCARLSPKSNRDRVKSCIGVVSFAHINSSHNFNGAKHFTLIQQENMNFAGRYQLSGPSPFPVAKDEAEPSLPMRRNLGLRTKPNKNKVTKRRSSLTKRRRSSIRQTESSKKN